MIIGNPERLREIIEETHPYFTHPGAEEVVTTMKGQMNAYAARFGVFADKVWREEYLSSPASQPVAPPPASVPLWRRNLVRKLLLTPI